MRIPLSRALLGAGALAALSAPAAAQFNAVPPFPLDNPMRMRAIEAVCTGASPVTQSDPRWSAFPLRIELAGDAAAATVTLSQGDEALASVNCAAPWVLFRIPPGDYEVSAERGGKTAASRLTLAGPGQTRLVLRFP